MNEASNSANVLYGHIHIDSVRTPTIIKEAVPISRHRKSISTPTNPRPPKRLRQHPRATKTICLPGWMTLSLVVTRGPAASLNSNLDSAQPTAFNSLKLMDEAFSRICTLYRCRYLFCDSAALSIVEVWLCRPVRCLKYMLSVCETAIDIKENYNRQYEALDIFRNTRRRVEA